MYSLRANVAALARCGLKPTCPLKVTRRGRLVLHAGGWARAGKESDRAPLCGPNMVPLPEMKSLLRTLMAFGKLAKA